MNTLKAKEVMEGLDYLFSALMISVDPWDPHGGQ